ncbi:acetate--CoA ligase [Cereibacter sphaeroides]|uniref:acetate--CoA ligase n=1 Tax=Cereibacter sphaeroides TaxID=1063 RepID=UPI001F3446B8|nr:acetate--CoA ligase [Cereibacter sphaeroides]MCE6967250.1 acetate--CoA ligase [Cereibacter sphaeroides]
MSWPTICKTAEERDAAVLTDAVRARFNWAVARGMLEGLPNGGLNIAHEAVDRHVAAGHGDQPAILWFGRDGRTRAFGYRDLAQASSRFANVLAQQGLVPGELLYSLMGRNPELYVAALGALRAGVVFSPLFPEFGPEPVRTRIEIGRARALVTTGAIYRRKVAPWRHEVPWLKLVLIAGDDLPEDCIALDAAMAAAPHAHDMARTKPDDPALVHFTSGTTGRPKGVVHVHDAVVMHAMAGRYALELTPGTRYWCTADPGWVTGTSFGIISPLVNRATMIVDEADFDLDRWYGRLQDEKVEVWYTAPTAIRMMMRAGRDAAFGHDFSSLRFLASVGEPLNPEAVAWSRQVFGKPFHDNWWQTETGGIMIANTRAMDIRPGSMGKPLPGIEAAILARDEGGVRPCGAGETGELALKAGWPSMMRGYLHEDARYRACFSDGWYLSGDLATRDADGYFWFVGRKDDMIKSAGHLIGPFEVESALLEHPAVAEAAVIGLPDQTAGEVVKAYVTLNPGIAPSDELEREIRGFARQRLGPAVAPRAVVFCKDLPRTRSGKIMRRLLRARELGLPEGDVSALEGAGP